MKYLLLLLLVGCSMNVKKKCRQADWRAVGEMDARSGLKRSQYRTYQDKCHEVGVDVDTRLYLSGYEQGLKMYCTYETGYELGLNGKPLSVKCPDGSIKNFMRGYKSGKRLYQTRNY